MSMPIDLKQLHYAELAERCGSFRKAADSLSLKQSNVSRRIRSLEDKLGVRLFERTTGGATATPAGREFLRRVRRVLDELQTTVDDAAAVGRGDAGWITIGFYTSLSTGNLRATLVEYARRFPQVEISPVEGSRSCLFDGIRNGTVDIAIVTDEPAKDFIGSMVLWSERILVALPADHPLAANEIIYWTDLKRERFLLSERDPGPEIQDILMAKLSSPGDPPDVVRHDVSPENIKSLVGAGRGISLMSEACMGASFAGVVYREVRDGNGSTRLGYRAHWRDANDNPALANFIRLLEERCPPHGRKKRFPLWRG
jgi:DNA-binding transcriptional LysR family regulator